MSARPTAIEALAISPTTSGLVFDFDGVVSPITDDPAVSTLPDEVAATLRRLAKRLGLLAVISGRPLSFLRERVRISGVQLLGSYGIERLKNGEPWIDPAAAHWQDKVHAARDRVTELLADWPGVSVEEKAISVAAHWRQAPDRDAAEAEVRRVMAQTAAETGLRVVNGKLVQELRPPIDVDKGTAISALLADESLTAVAYAGDDLGDLPALRAVRKIGGFALVVDHGAETDAELLKVADQTFHGTDGYATWLSALADATGA